LGAAEGISLTEEPSTDKDTDIASNFFDGCHTYLSILDRVDQLSRKGKMLRGSERQYDAAELNSRIWAVIRHLNGSEVPPARILDGYLAGEGITSAGGLRRALRDAIVAESAKEESDAIGIAEARSALDEAE